MDVHEPEVRSYNMSRIRSRDTKPEMLVRRYLFSKGFRFRVNLKTLSGKPDVVLAKYRTVIFVHGCFWHGHQGCKDYVIPKMRTDWWINKIERNKELDRLHKDKLTQEGWKVMMIFECELKPKVRGESLENLVKQIKYKLN
jgi:DNA mismatch endonuclease, patch repair protein